MRSPNRWIAKESGSAKWGLLAEALSFCLFICIGAAPCRLDNKEYAVYSAVLFPETGSGKQEPAATPSDILSPPPNLAGVWPGPYTIFPSTMTVSAKVLEGKGAALLKDFNRKNIQACQIEASRMATALPEANRIQVHVSSNAEMKNQEGLSGDLIRISRVGFNKEKTEAVVEAHALYDPEAGIGYRVFLKKAASSGKWLLQDVVKTRQF
jgi:hypothetical protein